MKVLHLACLNNDPEIQPNMGRKCNPVGGEPHRCWSQSNGDSVFIFFRDSGHLGAIKRESSL